MEGYPIPSGSQIYGDEVAASLAAIGCMFRLSSRHRSSKEKFLVTFEVKPFRILCKHHLVIFHFMR